MREMKMTSAMLDGPVRELRGSRATMFGGWFLMPLPALLGTVALNVVCALRDMTAALASVVGAAQFESSRAQGTKFRPGRTVRL